jgi:anti-anti-sigma regulatory factor
MNFSVDQAEGDQPVTILRLEGDLDAANFETVIEEGTRLHAEGTSNLLVDLRAVPFMGSSGLVALHSLALLLAGGPGDDLSSGWEAQHAIARAVEGGMQNHLKVLLPPDPDSSLARVMDRTGMNRFIEVCTDEATAIAAF